MNILMIEPFNGVYMGLWTLFIAVFVLLTHWIKGKSAAFREKLLTYLMLAGLAVYFWYKYMLSKDTDYSAITAAAGEGGFDWWKELPLQLCNINLILVPVSILTGKRELQSFCFFLGPIGALMAILMPCTGFEYYSLLLPRIFGYYFTHLLVFFGSISLCSFGIYRPRFSELKKTGFTVLVLSFVIFAFNMFLRLTGICVNANYFYTVEPFGNPILELLYRLIPVPYFYVLPCLLVLIPYMLLVTRLLNREKSCDESTPEEAF